MVSIYFSHGFAEHTSKERAEHGNLLAFFVRQSTLFVFLLQDRPRLLRDICTCRVNRGEIVWWLLDMPVVKIKEVTDNR
jgi:hypothetical protein